jgi:hypothetical protein
MYRFRDFSSERITAIMLPYNMQKKSDIITSPVFNMTQEYVSYGYYCTLKRQHAPDVNR